MRSLSRLLPVVVLLGALVAPAAAPAKFMTGFTASEVHYEGSSDTRNKWYDRTKQTGAKVFRIDVPWRFIARTQPAVPTSFADPAYDWSRIDDQVARAGARGFEILLTVYRAPDWAEAPGRPSDAAPGVWKPNPAAFGAFGRAIAERYDGTQGFPRVKYFEAWNETNLGTFLKPQWSNGKNIVSADHYRNMLNAFYDGVKAARGDNQVLAAGTAPYGDNVGTGISPKVGGRTRPLQFYRELMCLKRTKNKAAKCPVKPKFDIAAVHPINRSGSPRQSALHDDDIVTPDVKNLVKAVRFAEKTKRIAPTGKKNRKIWATEIWQETNPPDKKDGVKLGKASAWVAESLYLFWQQGVETVINYRIRDDALGGAGAGGEAISIQAGLWYHPSVKGGAQKKPLFTAFRFPFVSERKSAKKLQVWGRAPQNGKVKIEVKKGKKWKTAKTARAKGDGVFKTKLKGSAYKKKTKLRAQVGKERSNVWKQK